VLNVAGIDRARYLERRDHLAMDASRGEKTSERARDRERERERETLAIGHSSAETGSLSSFVAAAVAVAVAAAAEPITPRRLDLQIRSGISILSALQIDNARGATRGLPAEEKTLKRPPMTLCGY